MAVGPSSSLKLLPPAAVEPAIFVPDVPLTDPAQNEKNAFVHDPLAVSPGGKRMIRLFP